MVRNESLLLEIEIKNNEFIVEIVKIILSLFEKQSFNFIKVRIFTNKTSVLNIPLEFGLLNIELYFTIVKLVVRYPYRLANILIY